MGLGQLPPLPSLVPLVMEGVQFVIELDQNSDVTSAGLDVLGLFYGRLYYSVGLRLVVWVHCHEYKFKWSACEYEYECTFS